MAPPPGQTTAARKNGKRTIFFRLFMLMKRHHNITSPKRGFSIDLFDNTSPLLHERSLTVWPAEVNVIEHETFTERYIVGQFAPAGGLPRVGCSASRFRTAIVFIRSAGSSAVSSTYDLMA